ncbi:MAG: exodeoxyribonuclease VII large subunit [Tannerellaceae bacterium]|nr:exodeoxyribonuclease VII large subunit [Tannerellaceae bacterium]
MTQPPNDPQQIKALSLLELNNRIKGVINRSFPDTCWVRAETSDVRTNASSGHCYLEFIEKSGTSGQLIAKARASIWAKTFRGLKPYFERETGQPFTSGLNVLVKVSVDFHELYGFSLTVLDIDPAYTLGDRLRKRMEIIRKLKEDGVFTLNRELPFPTLPQRIAIITSPTAAGYEDFLDQLAGNASRYPFYPKLFPAVMQGEKTESSIIMALDRINRYTGLFDVVVIIRGGGATSDLNSFDSYPLAANCAQFPLPIITGIGHERDDTILDLVAHTRMKTPTAVAEFLTGRMDAVAGELAEIQGKITFLATTAVLKEKNGLQLLSARLSPTIANHLERNRSQLRYLAGRLPVITGSSLAKSGNALALLHNRLAQSVATRLTEGKNFIRLTGQYIQMASPEYILKRGYSLTLKEGKIVKRAGMISSGDELTTRFSDGEVKSKVL